MYSFVNIDIYNALPSYLQNIIINTYTISGHGSDNSSNFTSTNKLYLLSTKEVWGSSIGSDSATDSTKQLNYYKNNGVTMDSYSGVVKNYQGSLNDWWLRSTTSNDFFNFYFVGTSGYWYNNLADSILGVAPAFRIG